MSMALALRFLQFRLPPRLCRVAFKTLLLMCLYSLSAQAQTATVTWAKTYQVIDGFGASDISSGSTMSPANADLFFSTTAGVGLSLLRTEIPDDGSCASVNATCAGATGDMALASARGARIWSTALSPPASMKSNGATACNPGNGALNSTSYAAFATYLSNYIASVQAQGATLLGISIQNEPDNCPTYGGALMSAAQFDTFVKSNLGPTIASQGQTAVQVIMPETMSWADLPSYANPTLGDSGAVSYVGIVASHDYDYFNCSANPTGCAYPIAQSLGKRLWESEVSSFGTCDGSIGDALTWAQDVNDWMTIANANAWHYWWLINNGGSQDNEGLICTDGTVRKALYAIGNYSKFVRPGYYRIDATPTPQSGISVSAYSNASTGAFVVVVINQNSSSVSQSFSLNGLSATSVTPWITSASLNLAEQSAVTVSGGAFSYTLPADSITTLVGVSSGAAPLPATNLTATVF
jgi:glucuronoarabinoxylan endo-1,4-beta-xylanase